MGNWENRELCPDGACVGVIGDDGACNVCGTRAPNWTPDKRAAADDDAAAPDSPPFATKPAAAEETGDPDWDNRQLCPDGSCTGLVVAGGKCSVCGRTPSEITAESAT